MKLSKLWIKLLRSFTRAAKRTRPFANSANAECAGDRLWVNARVQDEADTRPQSLPVCHPLMALEVAAAVLLDH